MTLPRRVKESPTRPGKRLRSPSHLQWVREHGCCVPQCLALFGSIEAAHVRNGTDGGIGMKPGDDWAISLCRSHHAHQHQIGEQAFEKETGIDMKSLAREFASKSPKLRKHRRAA